MDIVLIVVAIWIALDVAIVAALAHFSGRQDVDSAGPARATLAVVPSRAGLHRPMRTGSSASHSAL